MPKISTAASTTDTQMHPDAFVPFDRFAWLILSPHRLSRIGQLSWQDFCMTGHQVSLMCWRSAAVLPMWLKLVWQMKTQFSRRRQNAFGIQPVAFAMPGIFAIVSSLFHLLLL